MTLAIPNSPEFLAANAACSDTHEQYMAAVRPLFPRFARDVELKCWDTINKTPEIRALWDAHEAAISARDAAWEAMRTQWQERRAAARKSELEYRAAMRRAAVK